jgi:hypothetical protein
MTTNNLSQPLSVSNMATDKLFYGIKALSKRAGSAYLIYVFIQPGTNAIDVRISPYAHNITFFYAYFAPISVDCFN